MYFSCAVKSTDGNAEPWEETLIEIVCELDRLNLEIKETDRDIALIQNPILLRIHVTSGGNEIYMVVETPETRDRLAVKFMKDLAKEETNRARSKAKLASAAFIERAPIEIVEEERIREVVSVRRLDKLQNMLRLLER